MRTLVLIISILLIPSLLLAGNPEQETKAFRDKPDYTQPYHYLGLAVDPNKFIQNTCDCLKVERDGSTYTCTSETRNVMVEMSGATVQYIIFKYKKGEDFLAYVELVTLDGFEYAGESKDPIAHWFSNGIVYAVFLPETGEVLLVSLAEVNRAYKENNNDPI